MFARTIGLPNDPVAAVELLAGGIDAGDLRPIGLGQVNGRFFCFHTGVGYDAAVVATVEKRASLKRWLGHPLFITAALTTWASGYDRRHPHFRVVSDSGVIEDGYFSIVLNTNPYTYLGNRPLDLSHEATLDRGLVAITFRTMKATTILRSLAGALRGGGVQPTAELDEQVGLDHLVIEHDGRRSPTSSTATTSARSTASSSTTSPTPSSSWSPAPARLGFARAARRGTGARRRRPRDRTSPAGDPGPAQRLPGRAARGRAGARRRDRARARARATVVAAPGAARPPIVTDARRRRRGRGREGPQGEGRVLAHEPRPRPAARPRDVGRR